MIINVPGENGVYGNNVTSRPRVLKGGALKSFIDGNFLLLPGRVLTFYIYSRGVSAPGDGLFYYLQIWRRVNVTILRYQLVWQQRIQVNETRAGLYTVSIIANIMI